MTEPNAVVWLQVMAIASVIQLAILIAAGVALLLFVRRTQARLDEWQRQHLAPVAARAQHALDTVQEVATRIRAIDDDMRQVVTRAGERFNRAGVIARAATAPLAGVVRGARAAIAALTNGRAARPLSARSAELTAEDIEDRARFTNEGGTYHARH